MKITYKSGLFLKDKKWKICCDPTKYVPADLTFISHAHSDHYCKKLMSNTVIASDITSELLTNFCNKSSTPNFIREFEKEGIVFQQRDSGHITGSTALTIDDGEKKVTYTGDVSIRNKGYIPPFKPEKCDVLIIESTFGQPYYTFPSYDEEIKRTRELIISYLDNHIPVVLMGYALGKAQMLYHSFGDLAEKIILHDSNLKVNTLLENIGSKQLPHYYSIQDFEEKEFKNWMMFTPMKSGRDNYNQFLRKKYNAKLFAFSGWCLSSSYKYRMDVEHTATISDHADFEELIQICEQCAPNKIYTIYGSNDIFAAELRKRGFNALPISKQSTLDRFL